MITQPPQQTERRIVIAGAGSVGCFIGGVLCHAGRPVTFLGRPRMTQQLRKYGLRITDTYGLEVSFTPDVLNVVEDPVCLAEADIILVTVKSGATAQIAQSIKSHGFEGAKIISLQNGISNVRILRECLGTHRVIAGMVPFNVVNEKEGHFHRGTSGTVLCDTGHCDIVNSLCTPYMDLREHDDMHGVLWGKLLINLNNALVALSDLTLLEELLDSRWRRVIAAQQREGLRALNAAGIIPQAVLPVPPRLMPVIMNLPTPLYKLVARNTLRIDPQARSSMWQDLQSARSTEIDELQGAIIELAKAHSLTARVNQRVYELIKQAEAEGKGSPGLEPGDIL